MEHSGHGDLIIMDLMEIILLVKNIHHQLKYLVIHGLMRLVVNNQMQQLKLMEHYGYGDVMNMDQQDLTIEQIIHHQYKFLALIGQ